MKHMTVNVSEKQFKKIIEESVRAMVKAEFARVRGLSVPAVSRKGLKLKVGVRRELEKASKDVKAGKNLSPKFADARSAVAYLKSR
jgi:hypothetical protein